MGVYIKGMKMQKNCINCPLTVGAYDCGVTGENVIDFLSKKPPHCPLVELPPHGRLIDADALKELYDLGEELDYCHVTLPVIRQNIDDMPTIIEAEEGE